MRKLTHIAAKFRDNKIFFLILLLSFLSVQWSSSASHIHLSEQHAHEGAHHEHVVDAHAHEQAFSYESSHSLDDLGKLVELDHDCNRSATKYDSQIIALNLVSNLNNVHDQTATVYNKLFTSNHSKRRYLDYSTINLRAPPIFS